MLKSLQGQTCSETTKSHILLAFLLYTFSLWRPLTCLFPPQGFPVCCSPNLAFTLATPTHPSALFAASPCQILTVHSGNTSAFLWTSDNLSLCVCLGVTLPSPSVNSTKVAEPGFVHHCVPVLYHSRTQ